MAITKLGPWGTSQTPNGPFFASSSNPGGQQGGGLPLPGDRDDYLTEFEEALHEDDAMNGAVVNGFWFPAHELREVDGRVYGAPFAPEPQRRSRIL